MNTLFDLDRPMCRAGIIPRYYQIDAHDEFFRLTDSGTIGILFRAATGTGKTLLGCLVADTWLRRGPNYRVLIVSYETQLVTQFAQEVEDYLGFRPGIEMDKECAQGSDRVVVASRASLLRATEPTEEQIEELCGFGVSEIGSAPRRMIETCLKQLRKGADPEIVRDHLAEINTRSEAADGFWSRLHKFDPDLHWLVIFDEAHRHAYHLSSVGHIVDWFEKNPTHRRLGLTATPKRFDQVSIGDKMFPGIALDYPLYSPTKTCAVNDGYAVPYVQIYIQVEGVDFKSPELLDSSSETGFDDSAVALELEKNLASFVLPTLAKAGERKFLIFSGSVDLAKSVAGFINARRPARCPCGKMDWYASALIGDGATCACGQMISDEHVVKHTDQAREIDGNTPEEQRLEVYRGHQSGEFQFLSVCGLCREGYNDPDIGGVAIFRVVTEKASSLAEQMKGRSCRILRGLAKEFADSERFPDANSRRDAIASSAKPNALIVDLVGITGLADCASTVQIYSEGLSDEIKDRAADILAEATDDPMDVEEAIEQAKREDAETRERIRAEREAAERAAKEEFERRAKAQAEARFSEHEIGYESSDPNMVSAAQLKFISFLGMRLKAVITKRQAGRIITQLKRRVPVEEVARTNRIEEWDPVGPSSKQLGMMKWKGIPSAKAKTGYDASLLIDARMNPAECKEKLLDRILHPRNAEELDGAAADLRLIHGVLPGDLWNHLASEGKRVRSVVGESQVKEKPAQELGRI